MTDADSVQLQPAVKSPVIRLANPRGFCAGVDRAIDIVNRALDIFGAPVYVRHEVVHNKFVVETLRTRGAIFVDELEDIPQKDRRDRSPIVIFSAHGVSQQVKQEADRRGFKIFDATCPLVTKVHLEVVKFSRAGRECVLIGHQFHPEVEGTMGQYDDSQGGHIYLVESVADVQTLVVEDPARLSYVTQTTLSLNDTARIIDALRERFPAIEGPRKKDICYATQNRQDAVKQLALECDLLLVVGSPNSSNSNRLKELAERLGCDAYLIDSVADIDASWFDGKSRFGVTAGASAPEVLVEQVVSGLKELTDLPPEEQVLKSTLFSACRKNSGRHRPEFSGRQVIQFVKLAAQRGKCSLHLFLFSAFFGNHGIRRIADEFIIVQFAGNRFKPASSLPISFSSRAVSALTSINPASGTSTSTLLCRLWRRQGWRRQDSAIQWIRVWPVFAG